PGPTRNTVFHSLYSTISLPVPRASREVSCNCVTAALSFWLVLPFFRSSSSLVAEAPPAASVTLHLTQGQPHLHPAATRVAAIPSPAPFSTWRVTGSVRPTTYLLFVSIAMA